MEPIKFGKYLLVELIASGGMAEIYKAYAKTSDGKVYPIAIKRILPQFAKDEEFISLLIDEAKVMVFMNHPNIVSIVEFGKVEDTYYIAMEYVEGPTLQKIFRKVREKKEFFDISIALYLIREIASGLGYAHRKTDQAGKPMHIVHRDISPANILISHKGDVKITDFGISKAANQNHHTQVGIIRGKTGYMSPEQTRAGAEIDGRSDLYSLGIILYELLTSQRLYRADSVPKALKLVREGKVPRLSEHRQGLPDALEKIVYRSLSSDPAERFQTGEQFCDAINEFLTKYSANKQYHRITHTDLVSYLTQYYPHQNAEIQASHSRESESRSDKAGSTSKVFAANPMFEGDTMSPPEIDKVFQREIKKNKKVIRQDTHSMSTLATGNLKRGKSLLGRLAKLTLLFLVAIAGMWAYFEYSFAPIPAFEAQAEQIQIPISTDPPGVDIFVDNVQWPEQTPTTLTAEKGKSITLIFSKADYKNKIRTVEVNENLNLSQVVLEPEPKNQLTRFLIKSNPSAEVWLDGKRESKKTPYILDLPLGKEAKVKLKASGYEDKTFNLKADEVEKVERSFFLVKTERPSRPKVPSVKPMPGLGGLKTNRTEDRIILSAASTPWAEVYLDGKKVGITPFVGLRVSAGRHELKFVNEELGIKPLTVKVFFPRGKNVKCIYDLTSGKGSCDPT